MYLLAVLGSQGIVVKCTAAFHKQRSGFGITLIYCWLSQLKIHGLRKEYVFHTDASQSEMCFSKTSVLYALVVIISWSL